jgi:hypothetical protein
MASTFELVVGGVVAIILVILWFVNRKREESRRIPVFAELISASAILIAIAAVVSYHWEKTTRQPLLLAAAVAVALISISIVINLTMTIRVRQELHEVSQKFTQQVAGLGNLQVYATKDATIEALTKQALNAKEKLIATRFSPTGISLETEYWAAIKLRAFDPSLLYIRIHCLAHTDSSAIDGVCRLIEEFRGAKRFQLGIAMFNNSFEIIAADERECIFCFNDLSMTIRNGFRLESSQPDSARVVANFDNTLRRILEECHVIIDFEKHVQSATDVSALQRYLRRLQSEYIAGQLPKPIHSSQMESYLAAELAKAD